MFHKMNSLMIFCFFFASIQCNDWCLLIAPDGNYRELGITRHWKTKDENSGEFVMYNKVGDEWLFDINPGTDYSPQNMWIRIDEGSQRKFVPIPDLIIKFGIFVWIDKDEFIPFSFKADILLLNKVFFEESNH